MGKANSRPTATRLREISMPGMARVPCIKQEKNGLKANTDRVALIGHDLQALCKVSVNTFNNHGVVVVT
jgi:hypothetical protein